MPRYLDEFDHKKKKRHDCCCHKPAYGNFWWTNENIAIPFQNAVPFNYTGPTAGGVSYQTLLL
jgi:hypothetical protein